MSRRLFLLVIFIFLVSLSLKVKAQDLDREVKMDSPFGALEFLHWNHPWNNYKNPDEASLNKIVSLMKKAGIAWIRQDFLWEEIEPRQGEFDFAKYDLIVDILVKNKIQILGLLNYSAPWASDSGEWNDPPQDNSLFVNYAVQVIKRYKDKIKYWEVWNEPDSRVYWLNQDGLKSYSLLLKDVYLAAKKTDPECKILNGGLAEGLSSVNKLYDNGASGYFDILNIHIFEFPQDPAAIKRVEAYPKLAYKIMSRHGDAAKKIWVTEIGSPGVKTGLKAADWWLGGNPDELQQAKWLKEVFASLLKDKNIGKIFWAFFRDCNKHWDNGVDYFGLLRWDYSLKPSFMAYQEITQDWKKTNGAGGGS